MVRLGVLLALVIAMLSLGLNLILIVRLNQGRQIALETLDATSQRLDSLSDLSIKQTVRINRAFAVSGQFPLNENLTFPISMTVPFDSSINVSVNTPLGPMNIPPSVLRS